MKSDVSKKKKWSKPKLIILVRGKAEESVLTACKYLSTGSFVVDNSCEAGDKGTLSSACRDICSVVSAS